MKKELAGILVLAVLFAPQSAFCKNKNRKALAEEVLVCARDLVDRRLSGAEGVRLAVELVGSAREHSEDPDELLRLGSRCEEARKSAKPERIARTEQFAAARTLRASCGARALVEDFIAPRISCRKVGIAASAALTFLGLGVKTDVARCSASDGRRWVELGLGLGSGEGLGAEIDLNGGTLERGRRDFSRNPFQFSTSASTAHGFLLGRKSEDDQNAAKGDFEELARYFGVVDLPDDAPVRGLAVAVGGTSLTNHQLNAEILPLGTDQDALYDRLMRPETSACDALAMREQDDPERATASLERETRGPKAVTGDEDGSAGTNGRGGSSLRAI